jgi:hypothetical protein
MSLDQEEEVEKFFLLSWRDSRLSRRRTVEVFCRQTTPACVCVQGQILCHESV